MAGVLSREHAALYDRWQPPPVGEAADARNDAKPAPPPGPTVYELEEIERQAREEGYAAGMAEGRAAARGELDERLARLDAICTAAARPLANLDDATERELAWLATIVAQRVVSRELRMDPTLIARTVREAAASLPAATRELHVWVSPADLDLLHELGAEEPTWRFRADPALQRGDCVLESARSRLDARVSTRLSAIVDAVLGDDVDDGENEASA